MASVKENLHYWEDVYDWRQAGEEWSRGWGGTDALWTASIRPRIARFLPTATILELAPGHGRFTPYLKAECDTYIGVDLSPTCVAICTERFPDSRFYGNDGATLPVIEDDSVDFIFSFFSLIHAEEDILASYLNEFARILKPQGGGFVHHSNLAQHSAYFARLEKFPKTLRQWLFNAGLIDLPQWRAPSVSAQLFAQKAQQAGLALLDQETVNFGSRRTIDAFSSFVRADGPWQADQHLWPNPAFMHEAMRVRLRPSGKAPHPANLSTASYAPLQPK